MSEYELYHYGVLGMKWGVRRARKKGTTYAYKSHATKVYAKKAEKFKKKGDANKAERYKKYEKRSADLDKKVQAYAEKISVGKGIAQNLFVNTRSYAVTKIATGNSKYVSRAAGLAVNYALAGIGDMPVRALYVRSKD